MSNRFEPDEVTPVSWEPESRCLPAAVPVVAARWAPDPWNPAQLRYWDGACWTGFVSPTGGRRQVRLSPESLGRLAAIAGVLGFLGSLVPFFFLSSLAPFLVPVTGLPAPIAVWAGARCLRVGPPANDPAPRSARRFAFIGIVFGLLGTSVWLLWCLAIAITVLFGGRDPFRGL